MPFDFDSVDTGATAWVLASAALVLLMTPGLAFFYGGMVRAKNVLAMLMQNFVTIGIVSLVWVVCGYTLAFGGGNGFIGDFHFAGLQHIRDTVPGYVDNFAQVIPPMVFVTFQLMFAVITPALIIGSTADRWKFGAFVPFIALWSILVYARSRTGCSRPRAGCSSGARSTSPAAPWSTSTPASPGSRWRSVLGRRRGWPSAADAAAQRAVRAARRRPAVVRLVRLQRRVGARRQQLAGYAFVNTNTAAAAALLAWIGVEKLRDGKATTLGAASGAVAGLVAITPAPASSARSARSRSALIAGGGLRLAVALKGRLRLRRLARRRRRPPRRRRRSARSRRLLRHPGRQPARRGRPVLRRRVEPARQAGAGGRLRHRRTPSS